MYNEHSMNGQASNQSMGRAVLGQTAQLSPQPCRPPRDFQPVQQTNIQNYEMAVALVVRLRTLNARLHSQPDPEQPSMRPDIQTPVFAALPGELQNELEMAHKLVEELTHTLFGA